jgi:hypothetical protein
MLVRLEVILYQVFSIVKELIQIELIQIELIKRINSNELIYLTNK